MTLLITCTIISDLTTMTTTEQHSRLIAAAPDLLKALKLMLAEFDNANSDLDPDLSVNIPRIAARAAVAKAEG